MNYIKYHLQPKHSITKRNQVNNEYNSFKFERNSYYFHCVFVLIYIQQRQYTHTCTYRKEKVTIDGKQKTRMKSNLKEKENFNNHKQPKFIYKKKGRGEKEPEGKFTDISSHKRKQNVKHIRKR